MSSDSDFKTLCTFIQLWPSLPVQTWSSKDVLLTCVRKNEGRKMCKSLFCVLHKFMQRSNSEISFIHNNLGVRPEAC